jgi:hypothetical protein
MTPNDFAAATQQSFEKGKALGWLTDILRSETFDHGLFGNRKTHESSWLFTDQEFNIIIKIMVARYRNMTYNDFADLPNTVSALFAWQQAGDVAGPKSLVDASSETNEGLICVLEGMSGTTRSLSHGDHKTLSRRNIEHFFDYPQLKKRLDTICSDHNSILKQRATILLDYIKAYDEL